MASPAVRLVGFLVLLAVMFAGAYAAGARVGPVEVAHAPGGSMRMNTGSGGEASRTLPPGGLGR